MAIEGHESYDAIARGTIDGVVGVAMDNVVAQGLDEVAPWMTLFGIKAGGASALVINSDVRDGLPAEVQKVMDEVSDEFYGVALEMLAEVETGVCDALIAAGGGVTALPAADTKKWNDEIGDTLWAQWREAAQNSGASVSDIESVESQWRELNAQYAEASTYESGPDRCIQKTSGR